jgi:hypothetical protein
MIACNHLKESGATTYLSVPTQTFLYGNDSSNIPPLMKNLVYFDSSKGFESQVHIFYSKNLKDASQVSIPVVSNPSSITLSNIRSLTNNQQITINSVQNPNKTLIVKKTGVSSRPLDVATSINSYENKLTLTNAQPFYTYTMNVLPPDSTASYADSSNSTVFAVVDVSGVSTSQPYIFDFVIKSFDSSGVLRDTSLNQVIQISAPQYPNRAYINVYKKNSEGGLIEPPIKAVKTSSPSIYQFTLTTNSEYIASDSGIIAASGSDPHVHTFSGKHYLLPNKAQWINLFNTPNKQTQIFAHVSGLKNGMYYDTVLIKNNSETAKIDFNKQKIKETKSIHLINAKVNFKYKVHNTSDARKLENYQVLRIDGYDNFLIIVDLKNRYIIPKFDNDIDINKCSGLLCN